ncbi:hypothetical protein D9619_012660 [Psilocybe cf. subviscida]|uniref:Uncharacterized protein n=1 Tax=Psilocybe cf. subviscida TaxID=2480587 RepID=A0A8H5B838_9AGAR|nr:hypothetical protein D9619_012660 [Psilocybe cf. subviscida]
MISPRSPAALQPFAGMLWAHVGLVGGCTKFPGFRERLEAELRALAPVRYDVRVWGARVDEAFSAFEDDDEIRDLEDMDVDVNKQGGGERGTRTRYSSSARTREDERLEDEDEEDAETKAAREKDERRKAARRKRDAERKKRLVEEAAAAGDGGPSTSVHGDTKSTVAVSRARGSARWKQKDKETETASAAGDGKGNGKVKAATPAPAAPLRPRLRSTRAWAAEMQDMQEQVPAHAMEGDAAGGAPADVDTDVQLRKVLHTVGPALDDDHPFIDRNQLSVYRRLTLRLIEFNQ